MEKRKTLTNSELNRYSKQIRLSGVGIEGQEKIKEASVLVIGAGALGCSVLQYLASAGVGTIGIVDNDMVDESNLHRQILYTSLDLEKPKPVVAKEKLQALNPEIKLNAHFLRLIKENALHIIQQYGIIADCTDNFGTRYLINDSAVILNKPFVYGAIHGFSGQVMVLNYKNGPTLRCIYPEPPHPLESPSCEDVGVIGSIAGVIGSVQATEVLKIILGLDGVLSGKMFFLDLLSVSSDIFTFQRDPLNADIRSLAEYPDLCYQEKENISEISLAEYFILKAKYPRLKVIDLRDDFEKEDIGTDTIEIPFSELHKNIDLLSQEGPHVFYCSNGIKSSVVISYLRNVKKVNDLFRLIR